MTGPRWRNDLDDVDIDPEETLDAQATERTRDPGADLDTEGVPADDRTSGLGEVPDPEIPAAPTDEPPLPGTAPPDENRTNDHRRTN